MTTRKNLIVLIIIGALLLGAVLLFRSIGVGGTVLWKISNGGKWFLPIITVAALVDSINPCAFSILLLTIAFLFSMGRLRSSILKVGGLYIFGIFLAYLLIGLGILNALHIFNTPHFMAKVGAILLVAFGLINILEVIWPKFPIKLHIPHAAHHKMADLMDRATAPTAFLLGALVGVCEFPCTGGPYLAVLGLLHDAGKFWNGFSYLIYYNLIFVLPLIIILLIASHQNVLAKVQAWQSQERKQERLIAGLLMLILGAAIFFL